MACSCPEEESSRQRERSQCKGPEAWLRNKEKASVAGSEGV